MNRWQKAAAALLNIPAPQDDLPRLYVIEGPEYGMVYGIHLRDAKKPVIATFTSPLDADWFITDIGLDRETYRVSAGMPPSGAARFFRDARKGNWAGWAVSPRRGGPVTWSTLKEGERRAKELEGVGGR